MPTTDAAADVGPTPVDRTRRVLGGNIAGSGGVGAGGMTGGGSGGGSTGAAGGAGNGGRAAGGASGGGGGIYNPLPSAGCMLANPAPLERAVDATLEIEVARKFPSTYDGVTPLPLILALHATGYQAADLVLSLSGINPGRRATWWWRRRRTSTTSTISKTATRRISPSCSVMS